MAVYAGKFNLSRKLSQYKYTLLKVLKVCVCACMHACVSGCYLGGQEMEIIETGCSILSVGSSRCEHPHLLVNVLEN